MDISVKKLHKPNMVEEKNHDEGRADL